MTKITNWKRTLRGPYITRYHKVSLPRRILEIRKAKYFKGWQVTGGW